MAGTKQVVTIAIAVTLAIVLFGPVVGTVADTTNEQTVEDEELVADPGEWQSLENYNLVEDSETVEWYDEGTDEWVVLDDTDYEMNYSDGEIQIDETSDVSAGDDVRVSYDWVQVDGTAATIVGLVPLFLALLILVGLAVPIMERM